MSSKRPPMPPPDLDKYPLPVHAIALDTPLYRIHRTANGAKYFGRSGDWRFDSEDKISFGTLYAGLTPEVAFVETLVRARGTVIAQSELEIRSLCIFMPKRPLKLVSLYGSSLTKLKATAAISAGPEYEVSRSWATAFWSHPDRPDGIVYRSSHDDDQHALVLFDRAEGAIDGGASAPLMDDPHMLKKILDRYDLALN